jgi:hypothetical protein
MQVPAYYLPRPPMSLDDATVAAFERLYAACVEHGPTVTIEYTLSVPKWQFLSYLCGEKGIVLHGSGDPDIAELVPRKATDVKAFGNREAIYAAADGIWPIYFAIVDRDRVTSLVNGCVHVVAPEAARGHFYFFSIGADTKSGAPWRNGTVYLLPGDSFERQPLPPASGLVIESTQVASLTAVRPLAKLAVGPDDFLFLDQVRRHDSVELRRRAYADPDGFPWLDE